MHRLGLGLLHLAFNLQMPVVKCEVISHYVRYEESNSQESGYKRYNVHTLRVKMGVLPEQIRPYGVVLYRIMMILYIPYLMDALYQAKKRNFNVSLDNPFINWRNKSKSVDLSDNLLNPCNYIVFIYLVTFQFVLEQVRELQIDIFSLVLPYLWHQWKRRRDGCALLISTFFEDTAIPRIDFENMELIFEGSPNYDPSSSLVELINNPGEQMEIDFSPVFFWCLFKPTSAGSTTLPPASG